MSSETVSQLETAARMQALLAECDRLRGERQPDLALRLLETALESAFPASDASELAFSGAGSAFVYTAAERAQLLSARAGALCDLNRFEEALTVCAEARNADPASSGAHFGLCFTLYLAKRWTEALAELEALVRTAPRHPNAAWLRAGLVRRLRGDRDASVLDAYALVLDADPCNAYAHIEYADVLRAWGRYAEARDIYARFQSASDCEDEALRVEALFKQGCVSLVLNDCADARAAFQAVLDTAPDYPDAREMLALAAASL